MWSALKLFQEQDIIQTELTPTQFAETVKFFMNKYSHLNITNSAYTTTTKNFCGLILIGPTIYIEILANK